MQMHLLCFDTPRLPKCPLQVSVGLADLIQDVAPKGLLVEVSGGCVGFTRA